METEESDPGFDLYQVVGNDAFYSGSRISRALMVGGNFRKSQFNKTVLIQANLGNAMMRGVKMRDANIEQSDAAKCKFEEADLSGTSFKMAKLRGATFEAQLGNATEFDGADFGFKLPGAKQSYPRRRVNAARLQWRGYCSTEGERKRREGSRRSRTPSRPVSRARGDHGGERLR